MLEDGNTSPRFGRIEKAHRICHFANGVMPCCLCVTKDARNKVNKIMLESLMMAVLTLDLDSPKSKKYPVHKLIIVVTANLMSPRLITPKTSTPHLCKNG